MVSSVIFKLGKSIYCPCLWIHGEYTTQTFFDAIQDGYGNATYLRLTNDAFVTGKASVAPFKPQTIVNMELTVAPSAVRQGQHAETRAHHEN